MSTPVGVVVLVTGSRGAGKTAFCRRLLQATRDSCPSVAAAGVLSPKVFEQGREAAIDLVDVATGRRRRLATPTEGCDGPEPPATPRWRFDAAALDWGDRLLGGATPCDLLIVDELGILELEQSRGWRNGLGAVDSRAFGAAFVVVRPRLLAVALQRWPMSRLIRIHGPDTVEPATRRAAARVVSLLTGS